MHPFHPLSALLKEEGKITSFCQVLSIINRALLFFERSFSPCSVWVRHWFSAVVDTSKLLVLQSFWTIMHHYLCEYKSDNLSFVNIPLALDGLCLVCIVNVPTTAPMLSPQRHDVQTNKRWVRQSVFLCWSPCSCFPHHSSLTCQWMKTSWNFLAKSIWLLPWCPSHKFPSLSLPSFLFLCSRSGCFCWVPFVIRCQELLLCMMGSSRKSVRMKCSFLLHTHIKQADLFLMELQFFTLNVARWMMTFVYTLLLLHAHTFVVLS